MLWSDYFFNFQFEGTIQSRFRFPIIFKTYPQFLLQFTFLLFCSVQFKRFFIVHPHNNNHIECIFDPSWAFRVLSSVINKQHKWCDLVYNISQQFFFIFQYCCTPSTLPFKKSVRNLGWVGRYGCCIFRPAFGCCFHMVNSVTCMNVGTSLEKAIK